MSNKLDGFEINHFDCVCFSDEHALKLTYHEEDNDMYASIHLQTHYNFFQRVWAALKYIFGYHCKYGHWDCFIFQPEQLSKLKEIVDKAANET